jgi:NADH dehydrogenase [ubiquinone] 1 alpha subcomplex assembly factor 7
MSLKDLLIRRIDATGPITVADYMAECLLHPTYGYYATRDPFGASGDFTTAPEISQMFGEMLGLCIAQTWMDQGSPAEFILAEIGPGRGTLMADMLRATARVPGFKPQVHLIEASPKLRTIQREAVGHATWHDDISTLPDLPLFLVGNEFFDALPIRQYTRQGAGWAERHVGTQDGALTFGLKPATPHLDHRLTDTMDGDIVESCPALPAIIEFASSQIETHGGTAVFIDYGDWRSKGDTLQALQNHAFTDPLADPGNADLTAHVDFEAITNAATCATTKMTGQGVLLERLGITSRAQALAQNLSEEALETHIAAHRRLTHPDEMGTLFKTIALFPTSANPPPGFDT